MTRSSAEAVFVSRSQPVLNNSVTHLVVGGVQWLDVSHLNTLQRLLNERGLHKVRVLVKGLGAGFVLPELSNDTQVVCMVDRPVNGNSRLRVYE